jgi:Leucine-rich repeat (LRR) protein
MQQTPLATVAQFAFAGLQNITSIYLSHNKIKKVEGYAFAGTSNLKLLVLTNNPIIKIESKRVQRFNEC